MYIEWGESWKICIKHCFPLKKNTQKSHEIHQNIKHFIECMEGNCFLCDAFECTHKSTLSLLLPPAWMLATYTFSICFHLYVQEMTTPLRAVQSNFRSFDDYNQTIAKLHLNLWFTMNRDNKIKLMAFYDFRIDHNFKNQLKCCRNQKPMELT